MAVERIREYIESLKKKIPLAGRYDELSKIYEEMRREREDISRILRKYDVKNLEEFEERLGQIEKEKNKLEEELRDILGSVEPKIQTIPTNERRRLIIECLYQNSSLTMDEIVEKVAQKGGNYSRHQIAATIAWLTAPTLDKNCIGESFIEDGIKKYRLKPQYREIPIEKLLGLDPTFEAIKAVIEKYGENATSKNVRKELGYSIKKFKALINEYREKGLLEIRTKKGKTLILIKS